MSNWPQSQDPDPNRWVCVLNMRQIQEVTFIVFFLVADMLGTQAEKSSRELATQCLQPYKQRRCLRLEGGREVPEEHVGIEELVDGEEAGMARHVGQLRQHDSGRLLSLLQIFQKLLICLSGLTMCIRVRGKDRLSQRDGEYKQRSHLRGFCRYPHRGVDARCHDCKTTEYKSTDFPLHSLLNVMYCVRVSLWTVKYSLLNTKEKGLWVISIYLWAQLSYTVSLARQLVLHQLDKYWVSLNLSAFSS